MIQPVIARAHLDFYLKGGIRPGWRLALSAGYGLSACSFLEFKSSFKFLCQNDTEEAI